MSNNNRHRFNNRKKKPYLDESYVPPFDAAILGQGLEYLKISETVTEKLTGAGITTVFEVVRREERDFYRIPTFDKRNLGELKNALNNRRLRLKPPQERAEKAPKPVNQEAESKSYDNRDNNRREARGRDGKAKETPQAQRADNRRDYSGGRDQSAKDERAQARGARNERQDNAKRDRDQQSRKEAPRRAILNPDGISEKRTKEEREKLRPKRPKTEHPSDIYIKINRNNKWGFATRDGKEVIKPEYDDVFSFKEDMCCVEREDAFGFIDRAGEVVIPLVYECAASFSEGYACVFKGGVCGYIDKQGNTVIPFEFDAGTAVTDGECRVKKAGKWGELHIDNPSEIRWIN